MKHNEIKVTVNSEEMNNYKLEKALKALDAMKKRNSKAYANKKSYISDSDWTEYENMSDNDKNDLFTRVIINKGFSSVQKIKKHSADSCDYLYINNISYVMNNLPHIVADSFIRLETVYKYKYFNSVHHAFRACVANAIYHCRFDDFSNASALYEINTDGEERCIIDTSNETKRDYEIDTELIGIAYAELSKANELIHYIVECKVYTDFSNETIARNAYLHGYTEKQFTGQYIGKIYKNWQESIN